MRTDLLLRLADLLEADAANPKGVKFALDAWAQDARHEDPGFHSLPWAKVMALKYDMDIQIIPVDCNTAACAMGLAAISGAFLEEGLTWKINSYYTKGVLIPCFGEAQGFDAARALFDISKVAAEQLFDATHYEVIKGVDAELEVASRLRGLVAGTWAPTEPEPDDYDD